MDAIVKTEEPGPGYYHPQLGKTSFLHKCKRVQALVSPFGSGCPRFNAVLKKEENPEIVEQQILDLAKRHRRVPSPCP